MAELKPVKKPFDLTGLHLALNIAIASSALWAILRLGGGLDPIWAISSMISSVDPQVKLAFTNFRGRILNSFIGCATGLLFLAVGGMNVWKLPVSLACASLISSYAIRIPAMWRQAPITAAIIMAADVTSQSKIEGLSIGLRRVGEVILGCVMGLLVTWVMSIVWPPPPVAEKGAKV